MLSSVTDRFLFPLSSSLNQGDFNHPEPYQASAMTDGREVLTNDRQFKLVDSFSGSIAKRQITLFWLETSETIWRDRFNWLFLMNCCRGGVTVLGGQVSEN